MAISGLSLLATVAMWSIPYTAKATLDGFAIVVAHDSSLSGLSFHELKQIFKGERTRAPSGKWLLPINLEQQTGLRSQFDDTVLGMTSDVAQFFWNARVERGASNAPRSFHSSAMILKLVNKVPGAIGYVPASEVHNAKVLEINGHLPGDPFYALNF